MTLLKSIILYESKAGFTKKCADYILKHNEADISLISIFKGDLNKYETVVLMTPVYMGKVTKKFKEFITLKRELLLTKRIIMVFVGMNYEAFDSMISQNIDKDLKEHAEIIYGGGAYYLEKLNFVERRILKSVAHVTFNTEHIQYVNLDKIKI